MYIGIGIESVSADFNKILSVIYRIGRFKKWHLSVLIGIGRYEKKLIGRTLPIDKGCRNQSKKLDTYVPNTDLLGKSLRT